MINKIPLDGNDWQIRSFYGEDWIWIDAHKPSLTDPNYWFAADVPGSIHADLAKAGEIPDPYFERNSLLSEWVPQRTWVYRKTFLVGKELQGKRISLHFQGVDYEASFYLNGQFLGRRRSMFVPTIFEVSSILEYGVSNLLSVILEPAPPEPSQFGSTTLARAHKPRMNYWWDFCPRIINIGIWDSVFLSVTGSAQLVDVHVLPAWSPNEKQAKVRITSEISCQEEMTIHLKTGVYFGETLVASVKDTLLLKKEKQTCEQELIVDQPHLWWPNGAGDPSLYHLIQYIILPDGSVSDEKDIQFGIRSVELIPNEYVQADAQPWTFVINGRKIYIQGWNWVPMDVLYGVHQPDKLKRLLKLARGANVNLLRIWGGGLIEKELFYDLCDQYGIMVWQEFILSCSGMHQHPNDDPDYVKYLGQEAGGIVTSKRNHPSLVMWCGGNELCTDMETPVDDTCPAIATLHAVVTQLDPDRLWLPTSPSHKPRSQVEIHGPWNYTGLSSHYQHYDQSDSQFYSEFGTEGITNLKTLNAVMKPEHQWPIDLSNPFWNHLAKWWVRPEWASFFGNVTDVPTLQKATQFTQAEGLKYALEAGHRRKYQNSGTLPWQFDEPFPMAACTSAVDYYGQPKPVYYTAAKAYEPVHVSAKFSTIAWNEHNSFEAEIWVCSSLENNISEVVCQAHLVGAMGKVIAMQNFSITIPANCSTYIAGFTQDLLSLDENVFFLDLCLLDKSGKTLSNNRYVFSRAPSLAPLLSQSETELNLNVETKNSDWKVELANQGHNTAFFVWLEDARPIGSLGFVYFQDNYFCLFPGEIRTIATWWAGVIPENQKIEVSAWNAKTHYFKPC